LIKKTRKLMNPKLDKGFTLIEILIVIFIFAIAGAIAIPMVFYSIENITFKTNIKHFAAVMRFARSQAINHKTLQILEINVKEGSYVLKEKKVQNGVYMNHEEESDKNDSSSNNTDFENQSKDDGTGTQNSKGGIVVYDVTHRLGDNNRFVKIVIDDTDQEDDIVNLFFYPKGNTTGSKVYIANAKDKVFSITLDKITGRVIIKKEENDSDWQA
jgi:prepilin-type N-terminal cleavage/methylation domain-containing protein